MTTEEMLDALEREFALLREKLETLRANGHPPPVFSVNASDPDGTNLGSPEASAIPDSAGRDDVHWTFPVSAADSETLENLRLQMKTSGLSEQQFAAVFDVSVENVRAWLDGTLPLPSWVSSSVLVFKMLAPAARRRLLKTSAVRTGLGLRKGHPFSRIEEL